MSLTGPAKKLVENITNRFDEGWPSEQDWNDAALITHGKRFVHLTIMGEDFGDFDSVEDAFDEAERLWLKGHKYNNVYHIDDYGIEQLNDRGQVIKTWNKRRF